MGDAEQRPAPNTRSRVRKVVGVAGWLAGLAVLAAILLPARVSDPDRYRRASCANNLKILGVVLRMYSNEDKTELMPSPSLSLGLTADIRQMYPEYIPDPNLLMCVLDPQIKDFPPITGADAKAVEPY